MVRKLKEGEIFKYFIRDYGVDRLILNKKDIGWVDENGYLHNEDKKPSLIQYYDREKRIIQAIHHYKNGKDHNIFGPAYIFFNEVNKSIINQRYFIDGIEYNKETWEEKVYIERNRIEMLEEI